MEKTHRRRSRLRTLQRAVRRHQSDRRCYAKVSIEGVWREQTHTGDASEAARAMRENESTSPGTIAEGEVRRAAEVAVVLGRKG